MDKKLIEQNLRILIKAVEDHPEEELNLRNFREEREDCNTVYCIAGIASTMVHFQNQGLTFENGISSAGVYLECKNGRKDFIFDFKVQPRLNELFGPDAQSIFEARLDSWLDNRVTSRLTPLKSESLSDKDLALLRLNYQLEEILKL